MVTKAEVGAEDGGEEEGEEARNASTMSAMDMDMAMVIPLKMATAMGSVK